MKRCELLIPAGGKKQYIAAVENGADAIYVGGKAFNARVNAENFSDEELEKAIDYGHVRNVKTYITMNTLLDDDGLVPAFCQAENYYKMGADGIIIQDLGLGLLLKEKLPSFSLHLSTQAGIYDAEGVKAAARLGYDRVVLARELSFEEIKEATAAGIETEVFVHGALCICYSGQCQLSRVIGGRSGNKGVCAQPCRLPYKGAKEPFPLSPKDLCLIEEIGRLAGAGVASLKVEGRMKSPEYVAAVTSIYRKYLDLWYKNGSCEVEKRDLEILKQIFNRGGFTKGYFYGDPGKELMASELSKNAGVFAGKIEKDDNGPFAFVRMSPEFSDRLSKGDYIEIRGRETSENLVTYAEEAGENLLRIGDIKAKVYKGDKVYRLASGKLMDDVRKTFESIDFGSGKYMRKLPVRIKVSAKAGENVKASAYCLVDVRHEALTGIDQYGSIEIRQEICVKREGGKLEKAKGSSGCRDNVIKQFSKTGGTPFEIEEINVEEDEPCYAPASSINALRRELLAELEGKIKKAHKKTLRKSENTDLNEIETKRKKGEKSVLEVVFYDYSRFEQTDLKTLAEKIRREIGEEAVVRTLVPVYKYESCREKETDGVEIVPYIPAVNKGAGDRWIKDNFEKLATLLKEKQRPIYTGSVSWIGIFAEAGVKVFGDSGLNVTNSQSERAYRILGAESCVLSLEKEEKGAGAFPLMITEHRFDADGITDRKGERYSLKFDETSHKTMIFKKDVMPDRKRIKEKLLNKEHVRVYI